MTGKESEKIATSNIRIEPRDGGWVVARDFEDDGVPDYEEYGPFADKTTAFAKLVEVLRPELGARIKGEAPGPRKGGAGR